MCQHREQGNIPDGFFLLKNEGILEYFLEWSGEMEGEREGVDIPHGICLLMSDGMMESATECVSTKRDRRGGGREAGECLSP
jgi:hypothetical protein